MNKKLIFRIFGALSSALMIVSVFVPYINVVGYKDNLWNAYNITNSLYLPIMIISFGAIGVIFFALNIKTEFAYMGAGAVGFFAIMQTIEAINQDAFSTLSLGYYFLVIGSILTAVMAFLCNLKDKKKQEEIVPVQNTNQGSVLDQIDKLYSDQNQLQNSVPVITPVNNVIEPVPIQPIEQIQPQQVMQSQVQSQVNINLTEPVIQKPIQTVVPNNQPEMSIASAPQMPQINVQPVNPVVQEFNQQPVNPVVQNFSNPTVEVQPIIQPQQVEQPLESNNILLDEPITQQNPVIQEFTNPGSGQSQGNNSATIDIFGQPINK